MLKKVAYAVTKIDRTLTLQCTPCGNKSSIKAKNVPPQAMLLSRKLHCHGRGGFFENFSRRLRKC